MEAFNTGNIGTLYLKRYYTAVTSSNTPFFFLFYLLYNIRYFLNSIFFCLVTCLLCIPVYLVLENANSNWQVAY